MFTNTDNCENYKIELSSKFDSSVFVPFLPCNVFKHHDNDFSLFLKNTVTNAITKIKISMHNREMTTVLTSFAWFIFIFVWFTCATELVWVKRSSCIAVSCVVSAVDVASSVSWVEDSAVVEEVSSSSWLIAVTLQTGPHAYASPQSFDSQTPMSSRISPQ